MLKIQQLNKKFGDREVCHHINLSVSRGTILAILGKSGSGKSTLLKILAGLLAPDGGEIHLNGENITFRQPEKREIAMMFQDFALLPHLNAWQNVAFGLKMRGVAKSAAKQRAENALREVGLDYAIHRGVNELSGGEQQRVALARALVIEPKLLLLDEPFSSLDTILRQQLQQQIRDLVKQRDIPALLVSHDPNEACVMADELALLHSGSVIQSGATDEVAMKPINEHAANLLGCLNVSGAYYIPPSAMVFGVGERCEVVSCVRLVNAWRVEFLHEKWGKLVGFSANCCENAVNVAIDENAIVAFQAA